MSTENNGAGALAEMNGGGGAADDPIAQQLAPLKDVRDRLVGERDKRVNELTMELQRVRSESAEEIKRLDRILRAAGIIAPANTGPKKKTGKTSDWSCSDGMLARAEEALKRFSGEFSAPEFRVVLGVADATSRKAIDRMTSEGKLVKVGNRPAPNGHGTVLKFAKVGS